MQQNRGCGIFCLIMGHPVGLASYSIPDLSPMQSKEVQSMFAERVLKLVTEYGKAPNVEEMREIKEMVSQDYRFDVLQQAQLRADKMTIKIKDQFAQGGWGDAFNDFITDLVTYPCAFVKGPVVRRQRVLGWKTDATGRTVVEPIERLGPEYERVDPFYMYPELGSAPSMMGICLSITRCRGCSCPT